MGKHASVLHGERWVPHIITALLYQLQYLSLIRYSVIWQRLQEAKDPDKGGLGSILPGGGLVNPAEVGNAVTQAVKQIAGVSFPKGGVKVSMNSAEYDKKDPKGWTEKTPAMLNVGVKVNNFGFTLNPKS